MVLILAIVAFLSGNILFGSACITPTIIRSMSRSPIRTQLMSVPPYATTFVVSVAIAFLSDRWGQCGYSLFFSGILAMVGYILSLTSTNTLFSTARSFYKPWERSHMPQPSAHRTSIMSNLTTSAPLPFTLDLPWPTSFEMDL